MSTCSRSPETHRKGNKNTQHRATKGMNREVARRPRTGTGVERWARNGGRMFMTKEQQA
jgi:ribosomal protein L4